MSPTERAHEDVRDGRAFADGLAAYRASGATQDQLLAYCDAYPTRRVLSALEESMERKDAVA